jgi:hypothetical protein
LIELKFNQISLTEVGTGQRVISINSPNFPPQMHIEYDGRKEKKHKYNTIIVI